MTSRRYFVTGTDTGVGKTFVTCALARRARQKRLRAFAFKPIETGCGQVDGQLVGSDQELLAIAAGDWQEGHLRGIYRFELPAAPLVAAATTETELDLEAVAAAFEDGCSRADVGLMEGAGGWRVPITSSADMGTLAAISRAKVLVVARAGLGTINHSLLTIEAIEREGLALAALILSVKPDDDLAFMQANAHEIRRRWPGVVIGFRTNADLDPLL